MYLNAPLFDRLSKPKVVNKCTCCVLKNWIVVVIQQQFEFLELLVKYLVEKVCRLTGICTHKNSIHSDDGKIFITNVSKLHEV